MTAPNTEQEPTLAEAFGEFANAFAESEDDAPDAGAVEAPTAEPGAEPAPGGGEGQEGQEEPGKAAQPQQPGTQQQPPPEQQPGQPPENAALPERKPLSYTVDGQAKEFEGGYIIPGHGAIITNDALPKLQDRLQQADRLVAQNQALYRETQDFAKLGGRAGFEKLQAEKAMLDASGYLLLRAITDENTLVTLATDPVARQQLLKEIQLTAREAVYNATNAFRQSAERENAAGQQAFRTQTAIHNAVGYLAQEFEGLTAEDVDAVRSHAARMHAAIVRPATPDEAREANVQPGMPVIDLPMLQALLKDRHTLRSSVIEAAKRSQTDALENAARRAAAAPTTVVAPRPAPRPGNGTKPLTAPVQTPLDKMSSAELTRAMRSGRIFDLIGNDDEQ